MNKLGIGVLVAAAATGGFLAGTIAAPNAKTITTTQMKDLKWSPMDPKAGDKGPMMTVLFGDPKVKGPIGWMLKAPAGFKPGPHTHTSDDYAVVIQGTMHNFAAPGTDEGPALTAGGTWMQPGKMPHDNHCEGTTECVVFVYMPNGFDFIPWTGKAPPQKEGGPTK